MHVRLCERERVCSAVYGVIGTRLIGVRTGANACVRPCTRGLRVHKLTLDALALAKGGTHLVAGADAALSVALAGRVLAR